MGYEGFFSRLLVSTREKIWFVKLSPEIPWKHTQNPDDFSFQQTHVSSHRWVTILWAVILCSVVPGQQEGTGGFSWSRTGVVSGDAGASVAPLCPPGTETARKIACLKRGRVCQWAFGLSLPNPVIPELTRVQTSLVINSVGGFVVVTPPFVERSLSLGAVASGNNFKDVPHHSAQAEEYRQAQTSSACGTPISKIQLRFTLEWKQGPLNVCAEQQEISSA